MNWEPTSADAIQINEKGIIIEDISNQIKRFEKGFEAISLNRPATVGDGILQLTDPETEQFISRFQDYNGKISKFVPASGAATRMFKELLEFKKKHSGSEEDNSELTSNPESSIVSFFKSLEFFAFYDELKTVFKRLNGYSLEEAQHKQEYVQILKALLNEEGMNYGGRPKGLIVFHSYAHETRTASLEQLVEGGHLISKGLLDVHFTVSGEHKELFESHLTDSKRNIEFDGEIRISYSVQNPNTDTIAVDLSNNPYRDSDGSLLFRPAGHGALLENLNELDQDLVFVKNIDNILPDHFKDICLKYKKTLGGVLIELQEIIFDLLIKLENGKDIAGDFAALDKFGIKRKQGVDLFSQLNRPIRVCGMVKNVGEPGGGPFWVSENGNESLQIVESAQVKINDPEQLQIFSESSHFNPVDLVCGLKDYKGNKFDLMEFRDEGQGFITEKSAQGQRIKAMELPGLWNGSMAKWLTVFVEVPLATFSPVKTVNDLLKKEHQPVKD